MKYVRPWNLFLDLQKAKASGGGGQLLGLDVGDKYVGLAVSDCHNKIASPLSVLLRKKSTLELMAEDFQNLVLEFSLVGFIVGCPLDTLRKNPGVFQVKRLIDDLCKMEKLEGMKYTYWDECYTSQNIELLLKPLNIHPGHAKTIADKFAAVGILQGYLDYVNRKLTSDQKPLPLLEILIEEIDGKDCSIVLADDPDFLSFHNLYRTAPFSQETCTSFQVLSFPQNLKLFV